MDFSTEKKWTVQTLNFKVDGTKWTAQERKITIWRRKWKNQKMDYQNQLNVDGPKHVWFLDAFRSPKSLIKTGRLWFHHSVHKRQVLIIFRI